MGHGDSKFARPDQDWGCPLDQPAHPDAYSHGSHRASASTSHDGSRGSRHQQQPEHYHSGSIGARAGSSGNRSQNGSESATASSAHSSGDDAGHLWCPYHRTCHPMPRSQSRGSTQWHLADEHGSNAQSAVCEARAENNGNRSRAESESVHSPSTHHTQRSAGRGNAGGNASWAGEDQVLPITGAMSVYYDEPGRAKGLMRHRGHRSDGVRGESTSSRTSTRSSGNSTPSAHSRQVYTEANDNANAINASSSASASHSRIPRSQPPDDVAEPYSASGRHPQRHRRVDIFGDNHSTDSGSSSSGGSEGSGSSTGGEREEERTYRPGHHVQFAIPEAEYQYFYSDSDSSSDASERGR